MSAPPVRVEGGARLRRTLKQAGVSVQDLKRLHRDIAEEVIVEARRRAPVRTGRLRDSLQPVGYSASAVVRSAGRRVPYANPIHWGWRRRNIQQNPFVLDAAESQWGEINNMYMKAIEDLIATVEGDTT